MPASLRYTLSSVPCKVHRRGRFGVWLKLRASKRQEHFGRVVSVSRLLASQLERLWLAEMELTSTEATNSAP